MKNKRGFTLIELLAVIVVLAIIVLIATPIVMNTIKSAKKGAAERTAENYISGVETAVATSKLDSDGVPDGAYIIDENGNLLVSSLSDGKLTIEMNGNKPTGGTIIISNGQVTTDSIMTVGEYDVIYNPTLKKYEAQKLYKGVLCTKSNGVNLDNLVAGNEFTCELGDNDSKVFYVLETNGDRVSLIMNANIDANGKAITPSNIPADKGLVAWATDSNNHKNDDPSKQAEAAKVYLSSGTTSWVKLSQLQITLPSAKKIATVSGKIFDDKSVVSSVDTWLYDYLNNTTNAVAGVNGYWTSSAYTADSMAAWFVYYNGIISYTYVGESNNYGIRPVITVSKANLS